MMKMAAALAQCMIRSGNGCRRRGDVARDGVAFGDAPACAIGSIRNCCSDKTVKKAVFKLEPPDVEDHCLIALIAEVSLSRFSRMNRASAVQEGSPHDCF